MRKRRGCGMVGIEMEWGEGNWDTGARLVAALEKQRGVVEIKRYETVRQESWTRRCKSRDT
jgi:HJR/Mrr/RecB family endonuclease